MIHNDVVGIILSGGKSRRMGSDKSFKKIKKINMLDLVIERALKQVNSLAINSNSKRNALSKKYDLEIIPDCIKGNLGPLAGILTGLEWAKKNNGNCKWVIFFPVDSPFFPNDLVNKFMDNLIDEKIVMAKSNNRLHPVFSMWRIELSDNLKKSLGKGIRKIEDFTKKIQTRVVNFSFISYDPFFNVNSPDDLKRANDIFELLNLEEGNLK